MLFSVSAVNVIINVFWLAAMWIRYLYLCLCLCLLLSSVRLARYTLMYLHRLQFFICIHIVWHISIRYSVWCFHSSASFLLCAVFFLSLSFSRSPSLCMARSYSVMYRLFHQIYQLSKRVNELDLLVYYGIYLMCAPETVICFVPREFRLSVF